MQPVRFGPLGSTVTVELACFRAKLLHCAVDVVVLVVAVVGLSWCVLFWIHTESVPSLDACS